MEGRDLGVLPAKSPQHADALEVLGALELHVVEGLLGLAVTLGGDAHEKENERDRDGRGHEQHGALPAVDEEGRDHRADDDEGGAQDQAEEQVEAVLGLLGVVGHARDEGGSADAVDVLTRERHHVAEQVVAHGGAELRREL